jgi:hypothetical protein
MVEMSFLSQGEVPHLIPTYGYGAVASIVALESIRFQRLDQKNSKKSHISPYDLIGHIAG